jgi:hypothetical protein
MRKSLSRLTIVTVALGMLSLPGLAQCPLCRTAASAHDEAAQKALDLAIIVLLIPAVSMFCGVYYVTFRFRDDGGAGGQAGNREEE